MHVARLILASQSPRRRELLSEIGMSFDVIPSPLEEPQHPPDSVTPTAWAEALAYFKARRVAEDHRGSWVLGADTLVSCGERLLGKPSDVRQAREMLEQQARQASDVITGLCFVRLDDKIDRLFAHATTRVWMIDDPRQREDYLAGGDWAGKAGAYGIQNVGDRLVDRIEGSFSNVVGLPKTLVKRLIGVLRGTPRNRESGR